MTWVVPLALVGLAIAVMSVFTVIAGRRGRHPHQSTPTGPGPRILVHDINDDRCTGCDACVAVCPTNVLDLVDNKSRVLRFADCIQCEACMWACPTEALVMFPEGSQPPPLKVPELDHAYQTAVPGQYLIGEVAGKPLVKNAANLGRAVIEHMLATGMRPRGFGPHAGPGDVDVAIVGSGPAGLSAALSCIQRGLTYVLLEKEQLIASTVARYPKGKLVMAEPYDSVNLSLLPVFDSSKEQIVPIWRELIERVGLQVRLGEAVESVVLQPDRVFAIRTTVAAYRAQRVVLATGTRGKPRTLQVPGENLPKVTNLLDDPDEWRGREVLVVGGGDSAVEAALALADAGARVIISYRGKSFNRAQPKNKQAIESYAQQQRLKAKTQSQVIGFEPDAVVLQLGDGSQKRYANHAAFVLIGADPPVTWLEKLGVRFALRPHQYALGKSDELIRRLVPDAIECPQDADSAAAVIGGRTPTRLPSQAPTPPPPPSFEPVSGPRKWVRAATSLISGGALGDRTGTNHKKAPPAGRDVPLSEFAKRQRTHAGAPRDALSAGERTRVLRMLRDEGGRLADEDSRVGFVDMIAMQRAGGRLHEDTPLPAPLPGLGPVTPPPARSVPMAPPPRNTRSAPSSVPPPSIHQVPMAPPPRSTRSAPTTAPPPIHQVPVAPLPRGTRPAPITSAPPTVHRGAPQPPRGPVQDRPQPPVHRGPPAPPGDIVAKPAMIVGLAQAQATAARGRGRADEIELGPGVRIKPGRVARPAPSPDPVAPAPQPDHRYGEGSGFRTSPPYSSEASDRSGVANASFAPPPWPGEDHDPFAEEPTRLPERLPRPPARPEPRQLRRSPAAPPPRAGFPIDAPTQIAPVDARILARSTRASSESTDDFGIVEDSTGATAAAASFGDHDKTSADFDLRSMAQHLRGHEHADHDDDGDEDVHSATRGHGADGAIDLGPREQSRRYPRLEDETGLTGISDSAETGERGPIRRGRPAAADESTRAIDARRTPRDWENE